MAESVPGLVSAIVPVYNGQRFLRQALDSILTQDSAPALEVIVVDDGSTESMSEIIAEYAAVSFLRQANSGVGAARNTGIAASQGEFLAFLDVDDLWTRDKLAVQLNRLAERPEVDGVFGLVDHFRDGEAAQRLEVHVGPAAPAPHAAALLIRRRSFLDAGFFSMDRRLGEFIDWYGRAVDAGLHFEIVPTVVLRRRIHGENTTYRHADQRSDYLYVLRNALERRRKAGL